MKVIVLHKQRAGFVDIFIPVHLRSRSTAIASCKPFPGGISVQNIPHGPVYPAGFAGYITLELTPMQTDILIAQASEAAAVLNDYPMVCPWPALQLRGLDNSKLAALLTALGKSDDATKLAGEGCLAAFEKEGPWVFVLPCSLRDSLAHLPESSYPAVAGRWAQHEELALDGWSADDVAPGLAMLKEHAVKAAIANKGLLLWMSL